MDILTSLDAIRVVATAGHQVTTTNANGTTTTGTAVLDPYLYGAFLLFNATSDASEPGTYLLSTNDITTVTDSGEDADPSVGTYVTELGYRLPDPNWRYVRFPIDQSPASA